jgi:hypothetical protein
MVTGLCVRFSHFDIDDGRSFIGTHSHLHDYPFSGATANYLYPLTTGES